MSDELTYLRWFHDQAYRFVGLERHGPALDMYEAQETYERETGNRVPNDHRCLA